MTGELNARDERRNRSRNSARDRRSRASDSDFINYELSQEQAKECAAWREDVANVVSVWTELVEAGYRVNTKYDDYSSSCAAFIIPDEQSDNSGYILTGRGGDAYRAICNALFKHEVVCRGIWGALIVPQRESHDDLF